MLFFNRTRYEWGPVYANLLSFYLWCFHHVRFTDLRWFVYLRGATVISRRCVWARVHAGWARWAWGRPRWTWNINQTLLYLTLVNDLKLQNIIEDVLYQSKSFGSMLPLQAKNGCECKWYSRGTQWRNINIRKVYPFVSLSVTRWPPVQYL